ncbi:MAG: hypothetical protein Q7R22_010780, partial [Verrucomicrobiota bacterium JB025]|nr:hypothetical protein [Verrucomicrobiota bacterium JB025]
MNRVLLCGAVVVWVSQPAMAIVDVNGNGMSDVWEREFNDGELFDEGFDPLADPDADGWTNVEESIAGTGPFDS